MSLRNELAVPAALALAALAVLAGGALSGCPGTLENPESFLAEGGAGGAGAQGGSGAQGGGGAGGAGGSGGDACPDVPAFLASTCGGSTCHDATDPEQGLDLASPGVADRVNGVQVMSGDCQGEVLADPADPGNSLLYLKVEGSAPCGERMPLGSTLDAPEIACIREWIGAL